jgi:hypothetical protein
MAIKNKRAKGFSPEQLAYIEAKALYETLLTTKRIRMQGIPLETDEQIDAYVDEEMRVEREIGLDKAIEAEILARKVLLGWCHRQVEALPQYRPVAAQIVGLFERVKFHPSIEEKLIDVSLRLRP